MEPTSLDDAQTVEWLEHAFGEATNMKRTLAYSRPALDALLEWYPLRDEVLPFLGQRGVRLFCHAISTGSDCLVCSTYFRRELIEAGENPDELVFDEAEAVLVAFGAKLATDPNGVDDELFERLASRFTQPQIVALTAFGALMVATNIFNNALRIDLDGALEGFRRANTEGA